MMKQRKLSSIFWGIATVSLIFYVMYGFGYAFLNNYLVDDTAIHIKAIIIEEENIRPNQGHLGNDFTYSYKFIVNGKEYKGDSHDPSRKVGDSVEVKYYKRCPYFNKPVNPKD